MRISRLMAFAFSCCLITSCSDDSKTKDNTEPATPDCQGSDCPATPTDPTPSDPQDPDPKDPTDPPLDPPEPECGEGIDLMTDINNCGTCGHTCVNAICEEGACKCEEDYFDCDEDGTCETLHECICKPGQTDPCYEGDEGTEGVGRCKSGYRNCIVDENGAYWDSSECIDQVLPAQTLSEFSCDVNTPDIDNDCNGIPDAQQDEDQDGFAICKDGAILDCCDSQKWCNTTKPELINPGVTIDCNDNQLDDNCNGTVDEGEISCSEPIPCQGPDCGVEACKFSYGDCDQGLVWNNSNNADSAMLLAKSMDICMGASSDPTKGSLIEYSVHRSGYPSNTVAPQQINILPGMKDKSGNTLIKPRLGHTFALLSTGDALDVGGGLETGDKAYSKSEYDPATFYGVSLEDTVPELYLSAHGNQLQTHPNCKGATNTRIIDSVVLHLKLQAPQDAKGFSFDFRFFTREFPEYVCTDYNDFFLTLMTDENGAPLQNADGNISFDTAGNPISVNNAYFTTCTAPSCYDSTAFSYFGGGACPANYSGCTEDGHCGKCDSFNELYAYHPNPYAGAVDYSHSACGGGTAWLTTTAPITGGQVFNLDFYIWDTKDSNKDSTVILDNFRWLCDAALNTGFAPPAENPIEIN
ncbi:MAG: choice-of-anchor L domain-containing protein [Proteobacteria bacterium]|nr:choice-of-anchor L domain-containing protein [Pseudomonadota bacterium]